MATPKVATNGVANPSATAGEKTPKPELSNLSVNAPEEKNPEKQNVIDKATGELVTTSQEASAAKKPTIEEIFARMEELEELKDKREKIVDHLTNLNKFYIDPSGTGCNLRLTDSKGNSFGIAHPSVIGEIIHMSKSKMQDELTRIETAISSFF